MNDDGTRHHGRLDRITLSQISAYGYHGVLAEEREAGQQFSVDVTLHLDVGPAAATDDLHLTVNYAQIAADVVDVITGPPVDLIETVAVEIAQRVLRYDGVAAVDVVVHKPYAPIPVPFADVTVQVHRRAPRGSRQAVLALGANLGDARRTLHHALTQLDRHPRVEVTAVSPLVRSAAVVLPGAEAQPDYLNAVALLDTDLGPHELLALCQGIELGHDRVRTEQWGPRTLDLDLVAVGDGRSHEHTLVLPHPRAHERPFVIAPWLRVAPEAVLPGRGPIAALAAASGDGLEWLEESWWGREAPH